MDILTFLSLNEKMFCILHLNQSPKNHNIENYNRVIISCKIQRFQHFWSGLQSRYSFCIVPCSLTDDQQTQKVVSQVHIRSPKNGSSNHFTSRENHSYPYTFQTDIIFQLYSSFAIRKYYAVMLKVVQVEILLSLIIVLIFQAISLKRELLL